MSGVIAFLRRCIAAGMSEEHALTAAECYEAEIAEAYATGRKALLDRISGRTATFERAKQNDEAVHVYVMVARTNGDVKIGISQHPEWRRKALSKERRGDLALVWNSEAYPRRHATDIERVAHDAMRHCRLEGEWFACSPDDAIAAVQAAAEAR